MEESRRMKDDPEKKKMFIKVGGVGSGGGIGAVVMLGSVLATAALASTFIVRKKGRSSGKDGRQRLQNPPPEIKKQSEKDEANNGTQHIVSLDQHSDVHKQPSIEAKKEIESDDNPGSLVSSQSLTMDEFEPKTELRKLENSAISDVSVIKEEKGFPLDGNSSVEPKTTAQNVDIAKIKPTKEEISEENSKHRKNVKRVHFEEEVRAETEPCDDGDKEGTKMNFKEAVERNSGANISDNAVEGVHNEKKEEKEKEKEFEGFSCNYEESSEEKNEKVIQKPDSGTHIGDGKKTDLPISDSHVMDHENGKDDQIISESHGENGQKANLPDSDNVVSKHENEKGDQTRQKDILPVSDSHVMDYENVKNEEIISESHGENVQKADLPNSHNVVSELENEKGDQTGQNDFLPVSDSPVIEHENVNGKKEENDKPAEIVEIVEENEEATGKSGENEVKYIQEIWVKEEKCDPTDEGIVFIPVKCEVVEKKGESDPKNLRIDENGSEMGNPNPENGRIGVVMLEQDLISLENTNKDEFEDSSEITEEVEHLFEKINNSIATAKDEMIMESSGIEDMKDSDDETDSSDEIEESSVGSGDSSFESNSEAVWPSESITESQQSELKGKTEEDIPVKKSEKSYITLADTEKNLIKHLVGTTMLREIATNLTRRNMIVGTGFALSTMSCSWFFGLSILKLCLIVFMTVALTKIHGY